MVNKKIWMMLDESNSNLRKNSTLKQLYSAPKIYAWVFESENDACVHRSKQHAEKNRAWLSAPFEVTLYNYEDIHEVCYY